MLRILEMVEYDTWQQVEAELSGGGGGGASSGGPSTVIAFARMFTRGAAVQL